MVPESDDGRAADKALGDEPEDLLCPVLHTIFRDPVVNAAGHTYERSALEQAWAASGGRLLDPLTNSPLPHDMLFPNWDMRRRILAFLDAHPGYVPAGWPDREVPPPQPLAEREGLPKQRSSTLFVLGSFMAILVGSVLVLLAMDHVSPSLLRWLPPPIVPGYWPRYVEHWDAERFKAFLAWSTVWFRRLVLLLSTGSLFLGYVGLFVVCSGLQCLGWFGVDNGTKAFVCSLAFSSGQLIPMLGATELVLPGAARTPLVLVGTAVFALGSGLRAVGWHREGGGKRIISLLISACGLFLPIIGLIEWRRPGFVWNVVMPCCLLLLSIPSLILGLREDCAVVRVFVAPILGTLGLLVPLVFGVPWSAVAGNQELLGAIGYGVLATMVLLSIAEWMLPGLVTAPPVFAGAALLVTGIALQELFGSAAWWASILGVFVAILGVVSKALRRLLDPRLLDPN